MSNKLNKEKNKYEDAPLYKIIRPIITLLFKILYTPKIEGKEFMYICK